MIYLNPIGQQCISLFSDTKMSIFTSYRQQFWQISVVISQQVTIGCREIQQIFIPCLSWPWLAHFPPRLTLHKQTANPWRQEPKLQLTLLYFYQHISRHMLFIRLRIHMTNWLNIFAAKCQKQNTTKLYC